MFFAEHYRQDCLIVKSVLEAFFKFLEIASFFLKVSASHFGGFQNHFFCS